MKNAIIFHGTSGTDTSFWFPWLRKELEEKGYSVSIPLLPDTDNPDLEKWLPVAMQQTYTPETIIFGHSAGGPLQLSVLEHINVKIKQAIIVAGYARPKGEKKEAEKYYNQNIIGKKSHRILTILFLLILTMTHGDVMTSKGNTCLIVLAKEN